LLVLVTGASGFLGAQTVGALLERGRRVIALTRDEGKGEVLYHWAKANRSQLKILSGDIRSLDHLPPQVEGIIHAAALRSPACEQDPALAAEVNVAGTANMLRLAVRHGIGKFLYVSSQSVYGSRPAPWGETTPPQPQGAYAITKLAGEQLVRTYASDLMILTLRFPRLYGVGCFQRWEELIAKFARLVVEGKPLPIHGDGQQRFDLLHVEDAAACIAECWERAPQGWGTLYNAGSGQSVTLSELVALFRDLAAEMGLPPVVEEYHPRTGHSQEHWELDTRRIREEFGWRPRISLRAGLKEYLVTLADKKL
jgi:nucleoside-diphosphate-sugar epimerase